MQEKDYVTPRKWKRKRGGFKYSTKKALEGLRMGKILSRVNEGEVFLTLRTILFRRGEDTCTNGFDSQP